LKDQRKDSGHPVWMMRLEKRWTLACWPKALKNLKGGVVMMAAVLVGNGPWMMSPVRA
jgi:hypothetical protein